MATPLNVFRKRKLEIEDLFYSLKNYKLKGAVYIKIEENDAIKGLKAIGITNCDNLLEISQNRYGASKASGSELEGYFVQSITLLTIYLIMNLNFLKEHHDEEHTRSQNDKTYKINEIQHVFNFLNIKRQEIKQLFPEYAFLNPNGFEELRKQIEREGFANLRLTKVLPNYRKIIKFKRPDGKYAPQHLGTYIEKLFNPHQYNENELIGFFSQIYKEIEKVSETDYLHLNSKDSDIFCQTRNTFEFLCNNIDGAKGHKTISRLTIHEVSRAIGGNASLLLILLRKPTN